MSAASPLDEDEFCCRMLVLFTGRNVLQETNPPLPSLVRQNGPWPSFRTGMHLESELVHLPGNRLTFSNTLHLPLLFGVQVNKIFLLGVTGVWHTFTSTC